MPKGDYTIIRRIGQGAQGTVYEVRHNSTNTTYALKKIDVSHLGEKEKQSALQEVRVLATLQQCPNPYVMGYIESYVDAEEAMLCLVLEWSSEGTLEDRFDREKDVGHNNGGGKGAPSTSGAANAASSSSALPPPLTENEVWRVFLSVALALDHCHGMRILHRDVKMANVFLHSSSAVGGASGGVAGALADESSTNLTSPQRATSSVPRSKRKTLVDRVQLGDFGVSTILMDRSNARTMVGTPYYLSPELCMGKPYTAKTDVWSLGVLLFTMLYNRMPFEANNYGALILRIVQQSSVVMPSSTSGGSSGPTATGGNGSTTNSNNTKAPTPSVYSPILSKLCEWMLSKKEAQRPSARDIICHPACLAKALDLSLEVPTEVIEDQKVMGAMLARADRVRVPRNPMSVSTNPQERKKVLMVADGGGANSSYTVDEGASARRAAEGGGAVTPTVSTTSRAASNHLQQRALLEAAAVSTAAAINNAKKPTNAIPLRKKPAVTATTAAAGVEVTAPDDNALLQHPSWNRGTKATNSNIVGYDGGFGEAPPPTDVMMHPRPTTSTTTGNSARALLAKVGLLRGCEGEGAAGTESPSNNNNFDCGDGAFTGTVPSRLPLPRNQQKHNGVGMYKKERPRGGGGTAIVSQIPRQGIDHHPTPSSNRPQTNGGGVGGAHSARRAADHHLNAARNQQQQKGRGNADVDESLFGGTASPTGNGSNNKAGGGISASHKSLITSKSDIDAVRDLPDYFDDEEEDGGAGGHHRGSKGQQPTARVDSRNEESFTPSSGEGAEDLVARYQRALGLLNASDMPPTLQDGYTDDHDDEGCCDEDDGPAKKRTTPTSVVRRQSSSCDGQPPTHTHRVRFQGDGQPTAENDNDDAGLVSTSSLTRSASGYERIRFSTPRDLTIYLQQHEQGVFAEDGNGEEDDHHAAASDRSASPAPIPASTSPPKVGAKSTSPTATSSASGGGGGGPQNGIFMPGALGSWQRGVGGVGVSDDGIDYAELLMGSNGNGISRLGLGAYFNDAADTYDDVPLHASEDVVGEGIVIPIMMRGGGGGVGGDDTSNSGTSSNAIVLHHLSDEDAAAAAVTWRVGNLEGTATSSAKTSASTTAHNIAPSPKAVAGVGVATTAASGRPQTRGVAGGMPARPSSATALRGGGAHTTNANNNTTLLSSTCSSVASSANVPIPLEELTGYGGCGGGKSGGNARGGSNGNSKPIVLVSSGAVVGRLGVGVGGAKPQIPSHSSAAQRGGAAAVGKAAGVGKVGGAFGSEPIDLILTSDGRGGGVGGSASAASSKPNTFTVTSVRRGGGGASAAAPTPQLPTNKHTPNYYNNNNTTTLNSTVASTASTVEDNDILAEMLERVVAEGEALAGAAVFGKVVDAVKASSLGEGPLLSTAGKDGAKVFLTSLGVKDDKRQGTLMHLAFRILFLQGQMQKVGVVE